MHFLHKQMFWVGRPIIKCVAPSTFIPHKYGIAITKPPMDRWHFNCYSILVPFGVEVGALSFEKL